MPKTSRTLAKAGITPPKAVQAACRRGLDLAPDHGGDGLTGAAKNRARSMAQGQGVSPQTLKRIKAFHARHTYEKKSSPPSPGYVAFMLWGGAAGQRWANSEVERMDKSQDKDPALAEDGDEETPDQKPDLMKKPRTVVAKGVKKRGKKKNLVGGNKGAWATAQEQARGKRNPEAYARRVYANITKATQEISDAARQVLRKFLGT